MAARTSPELQRTCTDVQVETLSSPKPAAGSVKNKVTKENKTEDTEDSDGMRTTKTVTETETTEIPSQGVIVTITKQTITTRTVQVTPISAPAPIQPPEQPQKIVDFNIYPHILENVARYASPDVLLRLRATCKDVQRMADKHLCQHVVPSEGENLRSKHARIWFVADDDRVRNATFIDLGDSSGEATAAVLNNFRPQLANIRLIRTAIESGLFGPSPPLEAIAQAVPEAWLSTRIALSRGFSERLPIIYPGGRFRLRWECPWTGAETIRHCVIHLTYHAQHSRMSESKLDLRFTTLNLTMPRTHYVLITQHEQEDRRLRFGKKQKLPQLAMPPVKPALLNTLARNIVRPHAARIILVDADHWSPDWLNRKFKYSVTGDQIVEETAPDAGVLERLKWWIHHNAVSVAAGDEFTKNQAIENISFITMAEFEERVPTDEMFDLMTDPVGRIGVETEA